MQSEGKPFKFIQTNIRASDTIFEVYFYFF